MGCSKYKEAPVGEMFGLWRVVRYPHYENEHYWKVLCTGCSSHFKRRASQLVLGRSSSCRSCAAEARESHKSPFWRGHKSMSAQYLNKLKHRKKTVSVSLKDLWDQWEKQKGLCAYTRLPLSLVSKDTKWTESTASIDRVDSSLGYTVENIQWVYKRINTMKNDMSEEEFLKMCKLVSDSCEV